MNPRYPAPKAGALILAGPRAHTKESFAESIKDFRKPLKMIGKLY